MARIFLSYARDDVEAARSLASCISEAGHDVWWDRHLHGGSRFASEIDRALKEAEAVVVIWSPQSIDSAWVQDEAGEGRDSGRLVPVSLGSAKPPLGFRQFQTIDLGAWDGSGKPKAIGELLEAVERTCGTQVQPDSAARADKPAKKQKRASVCVLPFINMSGDPEQEYFSDGISEDIITDLSKVSALSVIARNTAFTFKGQTVDVKDVAKTLGVTYVLEGSVRKAGNRVRITAQLIDGAEGDHVWADRYDRDLNDIFEIQDEISKEIVRALRLKLMPSEEQAIDKRGTQNPQAYNLYLMGRQQWIWGTWGNERRDEAIMRICKQAITLDPNYAEAWTLMALAQAELLYWHGKDQDPLPAAERALEINPRLAEPHCVKVRYLEQQGRREEADKELAQALRLGPESWEVNREAARIMFRRDRMTDAIRYFEKASQLLDTDFHSCLMLQTCYLETGNDEAMMNSARRTLERAEKALAKDPTNGAALSAGASSLIILGEIERGKEWVERALLLDPDNLLVRYNAACALTFRDADLEGALDLLQEYFDRIESPGNIHHPEIDPDMDPVREHPRFKEMVASARQRLGMTESAAHA
ncbi:MAG TPA: TIR domain-containing protein [Sphingomicrobium sp.]|nr:TIR domain-containing protein [Sphingomicrobium sp.]